MADSKAERLAQLESQMGGWINKQQVRGVKKSQIDALYNMAGITPPSSSTKEPPPSPGEVQKTVEEARSAGEWSPGTTITSGGISTPINPKYTGEEVKSLSTADALSREITDLIGIIGKDADIWKNREKGLTGMGKALWQTSQFPGSINLRAPDPTPVIGGQVYTPTERGQRFKMVRKSVGERILRLRSGAQINEKEYQRFMELLPQLLREDTVDLEALQNFSKEFQAIQGRIKSGALWDKERGKFIQGTTPQVDSTKTQKAPEEMTDEELKALIGE